MTGEIGGSLRYSMPLEVATRSDAYEWGAGDAPDDCFRIVDRSHPDRKIDPIFDHIPHEIRKGNVYSQARMASQKVGNQWQDVQTAEGT
ncbi:hypothetical protein PAMC26577_40455 [Caballeronia sordidicola]|uniref:Uncharacterized protein n=1 Tax=Caballeronia sordidicola TaxID=196367 RepID=A0A242M2A3_CABSO|nr:hypothetical protein PAMC26577_40455 [Caballeronia sordidicola]